MKRRIVIAAIASVLTLALAGCGDKTAEKEIKLGTLSGPHAEVAEVAAKVAKEKGLNVRIVEFSDYGHVNEALAVKDIDVNAFQQFRSWRRLFRSAGTSSPRSGKPWCSRSASIR